MASFRAALRRWPVPVSAGLWAAYLLSFPMGHATFMDDTYAAVAFIPAITSAHLISYRTVKVGAALFMPVQALLFVVSGHGLGWDMVAGPQGFLALTTIPVMWIYAGRSVDLQRRLAANDHARDRFVAAVAHDIKNPLTGVIGLSLALADDTTLEGETRELAALVASEAQNATDVVEDLSITALRNSQKFQTHPEAFDLAEEADQTARTIAGCEVTNLRPAEVWADRRRVRQIITNLATNATRYGRSPFEIVVSTSGRNGILQFVDHGDGIPENVVDDLFEPFGMVGVSGHSDSTGLGLSTARILATLMEGDLRYRRDGDRTIFTLRLPLCQGPDVAIPARRHADARTNTSANANA